MDGAIDIAAQKKFLLFLRRIILKKQILDFILRNPSKLYRFYGRFFSQNVGLQLQKLHKIY